MRLLLKSLQFLYNIYAMVLFVAIMLLIFPFVILASFAGRIKGGNMILRLCMFWSDIWFPLVFIRIKRKYESPHDKSKQYIFVTKSYFISRLCGIGQGLSPGPSGLLGKVENRQSPRFWIYLQESNSVR
jgi:1-acyl-sn-glycerol-3-phosphate acyltransferase